MLQLRQRKNRKQTSRGPRIRIPRVFNPRSRVSALLIVARGRGTTCVVLMVEDSAGARPRKAGTGKWPCFCGLCRFAADFKSNPRQWNAQTAKPRKPQKRWKAKVVGDHSRQHCRTESLKLEAGYKLLETAKQTSQHPLSPRRSRSVFQRLNDLTQVK